MLSLLRERASPISHKEATEALGDSGWDRATLYRNLCDLTDVGIARRLDLGDHVWRFELRCTDEGETAKHPHFTCSNCGSVTCLHGYVMSVTSPNLPLALRAGLVDVHVRGLCDLCQETYSK